jgi:O-antigen/teichoic acid export membrane protein
LALLKNTAWGALGEGVTRVAKLTQVLVMVRVLGATEIGRFNQAMATAALFGILFDFGIVTVAVREIARVRGARWVYPLFGRLKLATCLLGALMVTGWAWIGPGLQGRDRWLVMLIGLQLAFVEVATYVTVAYRARGEFSRETLFRSVFALSQLGAVVVALSVRADVVAVSVALLLATLANMLPTWWEWRRSQLDSPAAATVTLGFAAAVRQCLPLAGVVLVGAVYMNLDVVVLARYVTLEEVGWYGVAVKTVFGLLIMPLHFLLLAALPKYAQLAQALPPEVFRQDWLRGYVLTSTFGATLCLGTALVADLLVGMLFGVEFSPAARVLVAYACAGYLFYLYTPLSQWLLLSQRQHLTLLAQAVAAIANVVVVFVAVPRLGVAGAVLAAGATHAVFALIQFWIVLRQGAFDGREDGWAALLRVSLGTALALGMLVNFGLIWPARIAAVICFCIVSHRELLQLGRDMCARLSSFRKPIPA